jgi:hypothetical protein
MNKSTAFLFLVFLLPLFAAKAQACDCAGPGSPCQDYWRASAVFVGTVSLSFSDVDVAKEERMQAEVEMRVSSNPEPVRLILRRRKP